MPRLRTSTGDIVNVSDELAEQIIGHGYRPVSSGSPRRRADTGVLPSAPAAAPPPAPAPPAGREPEPTTAQLEQQLRARRSRSSDQH
jgi:hypothetical protein